MFLVIFLFFFCIHSPLNLIFQNCTQKESPPHIIKANNQMITLSTKVEDYWSGCKHVIHNDTLVKYVECDASRSFRSSRERWWFIATSRCTIDNHKVKYQCASSQHRYQCLCLATQVTIKKGTAYLVCRDS